MENGNFNCRYRKKIIVVDQLLVIYRKMPIVLNPKLPKMTWLSTTTTIPFSNCL